jgi:pyrroloquinoline quinone biosynthesis protein D
MAAKLTAKTVPAISRMFRFQWEEAQDCFVLLYPEGMVKLSGSAAEILKRCDGVASVEAILENLNTAFPAADLEADVYQFLETAYDNRWLQSVEPD